MVITEGYSDFHHNVASFPTGPSEIVVGSHSRHFFFLFSFLTICHVSHSQCARQWQWSLYSSWHHSQKPQIVTLVTSGRGEREKKRCFSVISEERRAIGVRRPLAFIRQSASSRTNTDVLRSDFKLFSPPKWLWGGKSPDDGRALKGASVI